MARSMLQGGAAFALLAAFISCTVLSPGLYGTDQKAWDAAAETVPGALVGTWKIRDPVPGQEEDTRIYRDDARYKILDANGTARTEGEVRLEGDVILHHLIFDGGQRRPSRTLIRYRFRVAGDALELEFLGADGNVVRTLRYSRIGDLEETPKSGWTSSRS